MHQYRIQPTFPESRGMIRKPDGRSGASSAKEASIGANISSAQVPTAFSSIPLQSYKKIQEKHNRANNEIIMKIIEVAIEQKPSDIAAFLTGK